MTDTINECLNCAERDHLELTSQGHVCTDCKSDIMCRVCEGFLDVKVRTDDAEAAKYNMPCGCPPVDTRDREDFEP